MNRKHGCQVDDLPTVVHYQSLDSCPLTSESTVRRRLVTLIYPNSLHLVLSTQSARKVYYYYVKPVGLVLPHTLNQLSPAISIPTKMRLFLSNIVSDPLPSLNRNRQASSPMSLALRCWFTKLAVDEMMITFLMLGCNFPQTCHAILFPSPVPITATTFEDKARHAWIVCCWYGDRYLMVGFLNNSCITFKAMSTTGPYSNSDSDDSSMQFPISVTPPMLSGPSISTKVSSSMVAR
jgi:hypothetical protein